MDWYAIKINQSNLLVFRIIFILYSTTKYVSNVSRLKSYLPRQKWTINELLIFFKLVLLAFNIVIPACFFIDQGIWISSFFMVWNRFIVFFVFFLIFYMSSNLFLEMNFQFRKQKNSYGVRSGKYRGCFTCSKSIETGFIIYYQIWTNSCGENLSTIPLLSDLHGHLQTKSRYHSFII